MRIDPNTPAREGCIRATDGTVSDAGFHDLDDELPLTGADVIKSRERLLDRGWSEEDVESVFPIPT